jgi:hypothetical protein
MLHVKCGLRSPILRIVKEMAKQRELLSLARIAEETGISYATLRNYTMKYADEIPSEGEGRDTRYPRAAVKVFQRLRKESKPGRKPASALPIQTPEAAPPAAISTAPVPVRKEEPQPVSRQAATDTQRIERELAGIRGFLESIAKSLELLATMPTDAPLPAAAAGAPEGGAKEPAPAAAKKEAEEPGGYRRLHSMPKVWGQRGQRPE